MMSIFNAMCVDGDAIAKKKTKRLKRFKLRTLMGHFQVPANIMAVKGLMLDSLSFSFTVLIDAIAKKEDKKA